jgi:hypothetical protein
MTEEDFDYWNEVGHKDDCPIRVDDEQNEVTCTCGPRPQIKLYIYAGWTTDSFEEWVDRPEEWDAMTDSEKDEWAEELLQDAIADRGYEEPKAMS